MEQRPTSSKNVIEIGCEAAKLEIEQLNAVLAASDDKTKIAYKLILLHHPNLDRQLHQARATVEENCRH